MPLLPRDSMYTLDELAEMLFVTTRKGGNPVTRVTLKNGTVIEGTGEEVRKILEKLGETPDPRQFYFSETHGGYLHIGGMNTVHLINAALKYYENWVQELRKVKDPQKFSRMVIEGIDDVTWLAIMVELRKRKV
jgi:hypothetical protein